VLSLLVCLGLGVAGDADDHRQRPASAPPIASRGAVASLHRLPMDFVENRGQWTAPARFVARAGGVAAAFETHAIRLRLGASAVPVALLFEGASDAVSLAGEGKRAGVYNYFIGSDAVSWRTGVPAYGAVFYRGMYDGVDVRIRDGGGRLEYDLLVAPGTDLRRVVIRVDGATRIAMDADGQLLLHTADGTLAQTAPATFERLPDGRSRRIESRFRVIDAHRYGFDAPSRDPSLPLVVDPGLVWSSFTGGTGGKTLAGIEMARDGSGDIFLSGITSSPDFSTTPTSHGTSRQHSFVARVKSTGDTLVYLTFVSGLAGQTFAGDMAGDPAGGVVVVGSTADRDLPVTPGAFQTQNANTNIQTLDGDGFVTRLDAAGRLVSSTYLGGSINDGASDVRFDPAGSIVVTGVTRSANFPTTAGAYDTSFNTPPAGDNTALAEDMFITRFTADLSSVTYSTFFGGQTYEVPTDMVIDAAGFVTIGGNTTSSATGRDLPITAGAFDSTWNGSDDGFIARFKLDGNGTADLKYSTFLGGINIEDLGGVAIDPNNPELITVAGWSFVDVFETPRFPTTPGVLKPVLTPDPPATPLFPHSRTGFVTRFRFPASGGGSLVWSTFTGGNFDDLVSDVAVDETGAAIVIGSSRSFDVPTTRGAMDRTLSGPPSGAFDCFVQRISAGGTQLLYSTYLGGRGEDCNLTGFTEGRLVYTGSGTVAVAGVTDSPDLRTTAGSMTPAVDEATNSRNLFVARLHLAPDASGDLTAAPPTLISPPNNAVTDFGSFKRFKWTDVDDPSGVEAYIVEISTNPDFPSGTRRLSTPGSEVMLNDFATTVPYHWRVRTADRAGNLSDWSATSSFTTGASGAVPSISLVQVYPVNVQGGESPLGVLHLTKAAPPGGVVVELAAKDGRGFTQTAVPLTVPASVTVPAGAISANFAIATSPVAARVPVDIYGTIAGTGSRSTVNVEPPASVKPASLSLTPLTASGTTPVTGTVTLSGPAPAGGTTVLLKSAYPEFASVPNSMVIPAGARTGTFTISTSPVPFALNTWIEAVGAPPASLSLKTPGVTMTGLTLSASTATGGANVTGTITFSGPIAATPAPSTAGAIVRLSSSGSAAAMGPLIVVPVGASSATFSINVRNVPSTTTVNITAAYDAATLSRPLTITGSSVSIASLTLNVSTLTGGQGGVGHVNLTGNAPAGHVVVALSASNPAISLPAEVTVSSGSSSGIFSWGASPVTQTTPATITAAFGSSTASANVTVNPGVTVGVTSLTLSPTAVTAGGSSTATLRLSGAAPAGGASVQLSATSPATVPPSVTVPAGADTASFTVGTTASSSAAEAKVWAVLNTTWGAVLTVNPGSSGPTLSAISLTPSTVTGGSSSQGRVTLTSAAPSGGRVVSLSSSNSAVATVPSSVTVPSGSTSATFNVSTSAVSTSTAVSIAGTSGASRTATLTVTPPAPATPAAPSLSSPANGATVALPVVLDWSDVAGAVSYQVHVDDSSTFSSPRVVDQTVAASQLSVSSLAIRQHWWRVRGRNSAGTAGAWSSVRSFTPQSAPAGPAALSALSVNPASVTGGSGAQGTVALTSAAPAGGFAVTLSDNSAAATVPPGVTVAEGATSASFAISTSQVTASTTATITAGAAGVTRTAELTITPPGQAATLTVSATGRSGERITSSPAGINVSVGSTGSASFTTGTSITLSVSNGRDAIWSGACSSGGTKRRTCTFTMAGTASVTANVQ
jgi:hypothetical protein